MKRYIFAAFILFIGSIETVTFAFDAQNYLWKTVILGTAGIMVIIMVGMIFETIRVSKRPKQLKLNFKKSRSE